MTLPKASKKNTNYQKKWLGEISMKLLICAANIKPKDFTQHQNTNYLITSRAIEDKNLGFIISVLSYTLGIGVLFLYMPIKTNPKHE